MRLYTFRTYGAQNEPVVIGVFRLPTDEAAVKKAEQMMERGQEDALEVLNLNRRVFFTDRRRRAERGRYGT